MSARKWSLIVAAFVAGGGHALSPLRADDVKWPFPTGSYRDSCSGIGFNKQRSVLLASCGTKGSDEIFTQLNIIYCKPGSIWNDDGHLRCEHDEANGALYYSLANKSALDAAAVIVMGKVGSQADNVRWMQFALAQPELTPTIKAASLTFSDASLALRKYLVAAATNAEAEAIVRAAYQQAYGQSAGAIFIYNDKVAAVKAGKSWYSTLVVDFRTMKGKGTPPPTPTGPQPPIH